MTPDAIAEELRRLRGDIADMAADIQVALTRIREEIRRPHPVEVVDLGRVDEWMFETEDRR